MKSFFYNRTAYKLLEIPVPECFTKLDEYFDLIFTSPPFLHESGKLAENLCRRMADVELFAYEIAKAQEMANVFKGGILTGTLLIGYFTACKSLMDAGAITLAKIYNLPLKPREMDFSKITIWKKLEEITGPVIINRYVRFKAMFSEIKDWRDAAVHRLTPLVIPHGSGKPSEVQREQMIIKVVSKPEADYSMVVKAPKSIPWVEPLHFHRKWRDELIDFCGEVCLDIKSQTF